MKPIGILGGGQLARMLVLEAHKQGLPIAVLSPHHDDPAAQVVGSWVKGDPTNQEELAQFISSCSAVTFESEFYSVSLLEKVAASTGIPVWPMPKTMGLLRDRLTQKELFDKNELPTAPWCPINNLNDLRIAWDKIGFPHGLVIKSRTGGYDGYGTYVIRNAEELKKVGTVQWPKLMEQKGKTDKKTEFIAESFIPFKRELAIIMAQDQKGNIIEFPFVESHQENSRCLWTVGPIKETAAMHSMKKKLRLFLKNINYVGAIGIELFDTGQDIIINEVAPRVHNSGHYTLTAMRFNQFTAHLFAVAGLKLKKIESPFSSYAMWNLLGSQPSSKIDPSGDELFKEKATPWHFSFSEASRLKQPAQFELLWYGKAESRPGRKLGHLAVATIQKGQSGQKDCLKALKRAAKKAVKEIGY